uniref:Uncharacterized protein n=1 Tax=Salix viminalis TaxID=40686 RepID=A0A6N2KF44_SALVM
MTRAGIGLADAYIDGDFSFADKDQGLLDLFLVLNANRVASKSISKLNKKRYNHEILELVVLGTFAIEVVKQTDAIHGSSICEQLNMQSEVKAGCTDFLNKYLHFEAYNLFFYQDNIKLVLCDYRELPKGCKYDRIVSW